MPPRETIRLTLRRVGKRMSLARRTRELARGAFVGSIPLIVLLALSKAGVFILPPFAPWICLAAGCAVGGALALRTRVSDYEAALEADQTLGLKERLSSAVQFAQNDDPDPLVTALMADAARCSQRVTPQQVVPSVVPREVKLLAPLALVAAALVFLPQFYWGQDPAEVAARKAIVQQGKRMVELSKQVSRKATELDRKELKDLSGRLARLGKQFQSGRVGKKDALLKMAELSEDLKQQQTELAQSAAAADVAKALEGLQGANFETTGLQAAAEAMMHGDVAGAEKQLQGLSNKLEEGRLSPEERQQLARDLERMAQALEQSEAGRGAAKLLREAAEALRADDLQTAMEKLQQAAQAMGQFRQGSNMMSASEAIAQLGRQLEETEMQIAAAMPPGDDQWAAGGSGHGPTPLPAGGPGRETGNEASHANESNAMGPGGPGPGGGSTNAAQPVGPEGQEGYEDTYRRATPRIGEYEALYNPKDTPHGTRDTRVRGQLGERGDSDTVDVRSAPIESEAYVPYYEVIADYQPAIEDALNDEEIPRGYREHVRAYFESLTDRAPGEPGRPGRSPDE